MRRTTLRFLFLISVATLLSIDVASAQRWSIEPYAGFVRAGGSESRLRYWNSGLQIGAAASREIAEQVRFTTSVSIARLQHDGWYRGIIIPTEGFQAGVDASDSVILEALTGVQFDLEPPDARIVPRLRLAAGLAAIRVGEIKEYYGFDELNKLWASTPAERHFYPVLSLGFSLGYRFTQHLIASAGVHPAAAFQRQIALVPYTLSIQVR